MFVISSHEFADNYSERKNSNTAEAVEFPYGTYQTFALQMWLGA